MIQTMIDSTEMMLQRWKKDEGKEFEVYEEFIHLTSELIAKTAFGSSYLEGVDIFENMRKYCTLVATTSAVKIPGLGYVRNTSIILFTRLIRTFS